MGFFDIFKSNLIPKSFIPNDIKRNQILHNVIKRMVLYGAVDPNTGIRHTYNSTEELSDMNDYSIETIFGFPEGSMITMLDIYWHFKLEKNIKQNDRDIFQKIIKIRVKYGFPSSNVGIGITLNDFILQRLRIEEPLGWSQKNIKDEELLPSIGQLSRFCARYWKKKFGIFNLEGDEYRI